MSVLECSALLSDSAQQTKLPQLLCVVEPSLECSVCVSDLTQPAELPQ